MKFSTQTNVLIALALVVIGSIFSANAMAREPVYLGLGGKVSLSNWSGDNDGNSKDYEAAAAQLGLNISVAYKSFYSGLSIQGGEFDFTDGTPDRIGIDGNNPASTDAGKVGRSEFDLVAGYYFWSNISLFVDLKSVTYNWVNLDYQRTSYGLGFGVSGFIPLSDKWSLYGSVGLVPLRVETEGKRIGDGAGSALTFGAQYKITPHAHISFHSNLQQHQYDFDNGQKQAYTIGSLAFGYNYYFQL